MVNNVREWPSEEVSKGIGIRTGNKVGPGRL